MSITFRKRPDHTLSVPEAKEPHLDLHSIDARTDPAPMDDDIPVLLPDPPVSAHSTTSMTTRVQSGSTQTTRQQASTPGRANSPMPVQQGVHTGAVHIPPPPMRERREAPVLDRPAWQDEFDDTPVLTPAPAATEPSFGSAASPRTTQVASPAYPQAAGDRSAMPQQVSAAAWSAPPQAPRSTTQGTAQDRVAPPASSASTPAFLPASGAIDASVSSAAFPGHPTADDYAPFLQTARSVQGHHSKPELYVWSDDENDAFSQAAQADFTLNRIQPTAGRPSFDASLFRAPSRPDALAGTVMHAMPPSADQAAAMQTEIDALVTELLDESHDYLKRRLLEEIPDIIAKYSRDTE
ncbi:hypothetical protein [Advenella mimigardefordensis]|uniref:Uncharacterized protein n=1 Tax=Advenella mimigardefordensis (strain DSM 17166 / LMG 22922 / DPN7) TaxID=1247726 RepID=W0PC47_ADVMD|nr:hypothetical protein [Advenella mimigardefordensis]AHG64449.1 hypothetical protein MIM_c23750 [Advenella mimigardefordensis DPN7]